MGKVALIHTGFALVEVLKDLFNKIVPGAELINIVDDSLLREVLKEGRVNNAVRARMLHYFIAAEGYDVDCIFNVCSSVGEVADIARQVVNTPVIKIDETMAEEAVEKGKKIGVAATLQTTLDPTCRMIEKKADNKGKQINIEKTLCPGAFEVLMAGKPEEHDKIVLEGIQDLLDTCDVVVLAQGSMARLVDKLEPSVQSKVLSSPRRGVEDVKKFFEHKKD